jgi:dTMP kinase
MVLIVIDGIDGSGKSTQARLLEKRLREKGLTCIVRSHPSNDNFLGRIGRSYLMVEGTRGTIMASIFYLADVLRSLTLYKWRRVDFLIFVRYLMGTSYLPKPLHRFAYLFFYAMVPTSRYMFFIDVQPEEAHRRIIKNRGRRGVFESLDKLIKVRAKMLSLAMNGKWIIVDGCNSPLIIQKTIRGSLGL